MPRYFFHLTDQRGLVTEDDEGQMLPNLEAARLEALQTADELWGHLPSDEDVWEEMVFIITDENGEAVLVVPFTEATATSLAGRTQH
jgi:hypothetical protein